MLKPKAPQKKGQTYFRKKGSEKVKKQARDKKKSCEICGKTNCQLHGHHILGEGAHPRMSNQIKNIIVVCAHCHTLGKISFHGASKEIWEIFDRRFPNRYENLIEIEKTRTNVDYEKEYYEL